MLRQALNNIINKSSKLAQSAPTAAAAATTTTTTTPLLSRHEILNLYKQLLIHAKLFPSIRRQSIYQGIQHDFRLNKSLSDTTKLRIELARGLDGLTQLQQYTQLNQCKGNKWTVDLSKTQPKGAGRFQSGE